MPRQGPGPPLPDRNAAEARDQAAEANAARALGRCAVRSTLDAVHLNRDDLPLRWQPGFRERLHDVLAGR